MPDVKQRIENLKKELERLRKVQSDTAKFSIQNRAEMSRIEDELRRINVPTNETFRNYRDAYRRNTAFARGVSSIMGRTVRTSFVTKPAFGVR
jgi:predicted  nucleic acid-binding Zn-ribbon protein